MENSFQRQAIASARDAAAMREHLSGIAESADGEGEDESGNAEVDDMFVDSIAAVGVAAAPNTSRRRAIQDRNSEDMLLGKGCIRTFSHVSISIEKKHISGLALPTSVADFQNGNES